MCLHEHAAFRLLLRSVSLTLAAAVLAACSQSQTSQERESSLRRGNGGEPGTLDPQLADDAPALAILTDLYEGLTRETARGEVVPAAAREWSVSADGLTLSFQLRDGLRWSNGDALLAGHFAAGLRHAMDARNAAPNAGLLAAISQIDVTANRLELRLSRPDPALPSILALPLAAPRHPASEGAQLSGRPVNGAYRIEDLRPHQHIRLRRNEHYREAATVAIASVTYLPVEDLDAELRMYRGNLLDVTSEVPNARLDWVRANLAGELHTAPLLATYGYAVNFEQRVDAGRLAHALSLAVDRELLVSRITTAGEKAAYGWVPEGFPQYTPARYPWAEARDELARTLRKGSAPPVLRLCTDASENHRRTALAIASMWREALGVELQLQEMEWKAFLATRRAAQGCDLMRLGWSADYLDPAGFLEIFATGHPQNTLGYASPAFDALLREARETTDARRRATLLRSAEARLLEDGAVIPLFFRVSKRLAKPGVRGDFGHPLGHLPSRELAVSAIAPSPGS